MPQFKGHKTQREARREFKKTNGIILFLEIDILSIRIFLKIDFLDEVDVFDFLDEVDVFDLIDFRVKSTTLSGNNSLN